MNNMKKYNIFILLSTVARNIVEVFSSVLLYKMGYSFREILLFYTILYFTGAVVSIITIFLTKVCKIKYILILSSIIFSISFYFMSSMDKNFINLLIFAFLYGVGSYSYHSLRHYLAIKSINNNKRLSIGRILIFTNIAVTIGPFIASYIQSKLSLFILTLIIIFISIVGIIPLFSFAFDNDNNIIKKEKIEKNKMLFFIFEQAKVINLSLEPLYLYLFVDSHITYIGIFNLFVGISASLFIYFFVRKVDDSKYFKYLNIIFCLALILKINITNKYLILLIGLIEGLGIKMFEIVSTENIYNIKKDINLKGYLIECEIIFCFIRAIMCLIGYFINDIKIILYISIIFIFLTGFINRKVKSVK